MCRIHQDINYHNFADTHSLWGVPNFMNVASNAPFLLFGIMGLKEAKRKEWFWFFIGLFLTGFGSSYYHLHPDNVTLVYDRLPMAIAFMAMLSAISQDYGFTKIKLLPCIVYGITSVLYWAWVDDLSPYILVQFGSLLWITYLLLFRSGPYSTRKYLCLAFICYMIAKIFEYYDLEIYHLISLSGHTLKHIIASFSGYYVLKHMRTNG